MSLKFWSFVRFFCCFVFIDTSVSLVWQVTHTQIFNLNYIGWKQQLVTCAEKRSKKGDKRDTNKSFCVCTQIQIQTQWWEKKQWMNLPSMLLRPHPSGRGRVLCFFSRSGIAVDTGPNQRNTQEDSEHKILLPLKSKPVVLLSCLQEDSGGNGGEGIVGFSMWCLLRSIRRSIGGRLQRTDLPSAIASDSRLPHGRQCGQFWGGPILRSNWPHWVSCSSREEASGSQVHTQGGWR